MPKAHSVRMPIELTLPDTLTPRQRAAASKISNELTYDWLEKVIVLVVTQHYPVSIRQVDWFVTNYSKTHKTCYPYANDTAKRIFDVHEEYKSTRDSYGRKLFDPFRRMGKHKQFRVTFTVKGQEYETTLAQLIFWDWADQHDVLQYCIKHSEDIDEHMMKMLELREKRRNQTGKRKRSPLSKTSDANATGGCIIIEAKCRTCFGDQ